MLSVPLGREEMAWERERVSKAADNCELAGERLLDMLEEGVLRRMVFFLFPSFAIFSISFFSSLLSSLFSPFFSLLSLRWKGI